MHLSVDSMKGFEKKSSKDVYVLESHNRSLFKFHKRRNLIGLLCLVLLHGQFCATPLSHSTNPSNLKNGSDS
jgi:hypothetical protein